MLENDCWLASWWCWHWWFGSAVLWALQKYHRLPFSIIFRCFGRIHRWACELGLYLREWIRERDDYQWKEWEGNLWLKGKICSDDEIEEMRVNSTTSSEDQIRDKSDDTKTFHELDIGGIVEGYGLRCSKGWCRSAKETHEIHWRSNLGKPNCKILLGNDVKPVIRE